MVLVSVSILSISCCGTRLNFFKLDVHAKQINKVGYFIGVCHYFSAVFWCELFSRVYSGMTCHNTSCQQKITVHILVTGSGGDALIFLMKFDSTPYIVDYSEYSITYSIYIQLTVSRT